MTTTSYNLPGLQFEGLEEEVADLFAPTPQDTEQPLTMEASMALIRQATSPRKQITDWTMKPVVGIFDAQEASHYQFYRVSIQMEAALVAGLPKDPRLIEAWIRTNLHPNTRSDEMKQMMVDTIKATRPDIEVDNDTPMEAVIEASAEVAQIKHGRTFAQDSIGLYLESRNVMAMLKEGVAIVFTGQRFGKNSKGARNWFVERVDVVEDRLYFGRQIDGAHMQIGHIEDKNGKRATVSYYDYLIQPTISFHIRIWNNEFSPEQVAAVLAYCQHHGLGALRSQQFGKFKVTEFAPLTEQEKLALVAKGQELPLGPSVDLDRIFKTTKSMGNQGSNPIEESVKAAESVERKATRAAAKKPTK